VSGAPGPARGVAVTPVTGLPEIAAGDDAIGSFFGDGRIVASTLEVVVLFDEQPVRFLLLSGVATHADEGPVPFQLFAMQCKLETTGA